MGQVLYRKYRSHSFEEIVGQDHVTAVLCRAIEQNKISHAYLFTGPRGVGKTSVARILAHQVNELPYQEEGEPAHLDIIEIDAASNRRIDEIRDLREKVHLSPTSARYKVYIIDEVHMLTSEAFNALLKTLEEPPSHVIFILATTESHKVPETIISRTQRFHFRPVEPDLLASHLRSIAKKEKIKIDREALQMIATHARGSFRDGLSLLDQVAWQEEEVTQKMVEQLLGLAPYERVQTLLDSILAGDLKAAFAALAQFYEEGIGPTDIARSLSQAARDAYLNSEKPAKGLIDLAEGLIAVEESFDPRLKLETTLVRIIKSLHTTETGHSPVPATPDIMPPSAERLPVAQAAKLPSAPSPVPSKAPAAAPLVKGSPKTSDDFNWQAVLSEIKGQHEPLYALLRMSASSYDPPSHKLTLVFRFAFHQKQAAADKNRQLLSTVLEAALGSVPDIAYEVNTADAAETVDNKTKTVDQVADILGGDIVELES